MFNWRYRYISAFSGHGIFTLRTALIAVMIQIVLCWHPLYSMICEPGLLLMFSVFSPEKASLQFRSSTWIPRYSSFVCIAAAVLHLHRLQIWLPWNIFWRKKDVCSIGLNFYSWCYISNLVWFCLAGPNDPILCVVMFGSLYKISWYLFVLTRYP